MAVPKPERSLQGGVTFQEKGCSFRVWAPHAEQVFVTGTFNSFSPTADPLKSEGNGWWSGSARRAKPGDEYRYRLVTKAGELWRLDPYCRKATSSNGNSIIHAAVYDWGDHYLAPIPLNEMVIYELHIGTFAGTVDKSGSLKTAMKRLEYLEELGVNAIEIMPIGEFAGDHSWGYNPALIFAIESKYGSPEFFQDFVKAAHRHGIAVILDVVYNHFGPQDLSLWRFDGWHENDYGGIYFYNDGRSETPWGKTRPDYGRPEVRQFIIDNALYWFREFKLDGLRLDSTAYMRNIHGKNDEMDSMIPDGWNLMRQANDRIKACCPGSFTIAEDLWDNPVMTKATKDGGAGFDCQWDLMFARKMRAALVGASDESRDMRVIADTFKHRYYLNAFERVIYTESHDEVANKRARIPEEVAPGHADNWFAKKKSCLGACAVFTAPGIPMIFQGQEFLEDDWFHDRDPLDWSKKDRFAGILQLYRDLIALRLNKEGATRGLCGQGIDVFHVNNNEKVIAFHRWDRSGPADSVVVVANFANHQWQGYRIGLPHEGPWKVRLNSDAKVYDSEFSDLACDDVQANTPGYDGQPFSGDINLAPYGFLILSVDGEAEQVPG